MIRHLACIMDGNRRWAKQYGWLPWDGHREGIKAAQRAMDFCLEQNIAYLSLFAFSLENFKRSKKELQFLFSVLPNEIKKRLVDDALKKNIRICFVGDRLQFPKDARPVIDEIERATKDGTALQVNLFFCYGARQEIMHGVKALAQKIKDGLFSLDTVTDEQFEACLWTAGIPSPELIIRTGGVQRLSNFLLYQAAYSELYFLNCFWPEITSEHLQQALNSFGHRQRNFGI